jgi:hypothetical protein
MTEFTNIYKPTYSVRSYTKGLASIQSTAGPAVDYTDKLKEFYDGTLKL